MRAPIVQQWAGVLVVALGIALFSVRTAVIVFGFLVLVGGIGRGLDARKRPSTSEG